ncbi:MAG: sodium/proline symporter [Gemmatimonadales bacterium]|nr:MAG: sodium/proline symporter [Gemmatimonadales bacterium]
MSLLGLLSTGIVPSSVTAQVEELPHVVEPTIVWVAIGYFVIVTVIGAWATRRTRTAGDFFVAGKGIGLIALSLSVMSATLSGFAFIGGPGLVYSIGLGAMFIILPAALTNAMGAWVLAKRLRLMAEVRHTITLPDAIGARYRSPLAQGLAGVSILVAVIGYMATNILALGLVIDAVFGIGVGWGIWLGMGITMAYAVGGGIVAGIYTDVFQGSLMAVASVLVFLFTLQAGGGLSGISETILAADPGFLGPWGHLTPIAALSFFFVFGMGSLGQPHVIHKFYMLRDPRKLRWYPLVTTFALIVAMLLYFGVGVSVKALTVEGALAPLTNPDNATPIFLLNYTPLFLAALVFSGVAAAIMSTVNSFMNIGAAAMMHDIPISLGKRIKNELLWGRICTVIISVAAALLAQYSGMLVAFLGVFGWGLFASTLVPALAIGLNWKGATRAGAIASIGTGLSITLVFETFAFFELYSFPVGVTVSGLSLVLSILMFFGVSWVTRETAADTLDPDIRVVMEA